MNGLICGMRINVNKKEGEPLFQNCILEHRHNDQHRQEPHKFEDPKITEEKLKLIDIMNRTINPETPVKPNFEEREFSSWTDNERIAFVVKILTMENQAWSQEQRKEFLTKFDPRDHYIYKGEELADFACNYSKLILEAQGL